MLRRHELILHDQQNKAYLYRCAFEFFPWIEFYSIFKQISFNFVAANGQYAA